MKSLKTNSGRDNAAALSNINLYLIVNCYSITIAMNTDIIVDIRDLPIIMPMT
jgi:hypothetical protein